MHGVKRVLIFCILTAFLPIILLVLPLYLRHNLYADVVYAVTESDVLEIHDGISTIFCSAHTLYMNSTFNAFQMGHRPEIASSRKHIRLKKSMTLPDDTLEYWGFYLLKGASVALSVCSRFPGASILVVRGERTLRTCGMLDHNRNKAPARGVFLPAAQDQVKIVFETPAQEVEPVRQTHPPLHQARNLPMALRNRTKRIRHAQNRLQSSRALRASLTRLLGQPVNENEEDASGGEVPEPRARHRRNQEPLNPSDLLDRGIQHGGNALKNLSADSSVSSFEQGLLDCYDGNILVSQEFDPSHLCTGVAYLDSGTSMQARHNVSEDGYYYYIFYSDNDFVSNDIHAIFDIWKPTFQYDNVSKSCINETKCSFELTVMSADRVIVEIFTKDGIEHEADDISLLISTCRPRMAIYVIFPAAVLLLILSCAFL